MHYTLTTEDIAAINRALDAYMPKARDNDDMEALADFRDSVIGAIRVYFNAPADQWEIVQAALLKAAWNLSNNDITLTVETLRSMNNNLVYPLLRINPNG